jgi:hypothetical protein
MSWPEHVVIVSGARKGYPTGHVGRELLELRDQWGLGMLVIHGNAPGVDSEADEVCERLGIDRLRAPANWGGRGRTGGPVRNRLMALVALRLTTGAVTVLAFSPDLSRSTGTADMVRVAADKGLLLRVFDAQGLRIHTDDALRMAQR